jgi:4-hydroxy-2-oxoheptanedioate aldolase
MAEIRKSNVLKKLRSGQVVNSIKLNLSDVRAAEIAALCGFDCLWVDMEHTANDFHSIENIIRAAKIYDVDVLTRVSKGCYSDFIRPLEMDSTGIMVPHLMNIEEAKQITYFTKFHPVGRRPIDGGNADGKYCLIDANEYIKEINNERFVVVQIEDPEVIEFLDEICKLPGIDMLFFGPGDFSQGIGTPNDFSNGKLIEAKKLVAKTARKHGKFVGTVGNINNQDELINMGYQFINLGADVIALSTYYKNIIKNSIGKVQKDVE